MISLRGPIERSRVICLEGGKYQTAEIAYVLASQEISMGNKVYWVDGGSLLDPTRIELLSLRDPVSYLDSLHACRAFTAHQMSEIFRRMERSGDGGTELQEDCLLPFQQQCLPKNLLLRECLFLQFPRQHFSIFLSSNFSDQ